MAVLAYRPTSWEEFVARERELDVWSFPHFVRYLRAVITKITSQPHRCTLSLFAALDDGTLDPTKHDPDQVIRRLRAFQTTVPNRSTHNPGRVAREIANAICEVIALSLGYKDFSGVRLPDVDACHNRAMNLAKEQERAAIKCGVTSDALFECAVIANSSDPVDEDRRDAALAAMSANHFRLAYNITVGKT